MANGKIVYPSGGGTTYNFAKNYDYGHEVGPLETDDNSRALDGTLCSYVRPVKKTYHLVFSFVDKAQFDAFVTCWEAQGTIDLYLDGTTKDATVKMIGPPVGKSEAAFRSAGTPTYSFEVSFEEV